jgi:hypothetical protein
MQLGNPHDDPPFDVPTAVGDRPETTKIPGKRELSLHIRLETSQSLGIRCGRLAIHSHWGHNHDTRPVAWLASAAQPRRRVIWGLDACFLVDSATFPVVTPSITENDGSAP